MSDYFYIASYGGCSFDSFTQRLWLALLTLVEKSCFACVGESENEYVEWAITFEKFAQHSRKESSHYFIIY